MSTRIKRSNLVALSSISIVMVGFVLLLASTNEAQGPVAVSAGESEPPVQQDITITEKNLHPKAVLDDTFQTDRSENTSPDQPFSYLSLIVANPEIFATSPLPEKLSAFLPSPGESGMEGSVSEDMIYHTHPLRDLDTLLETFPLQFNFSM